jgi:hypothetical protein
MIVSVYYASDAPMMFVAEPDNRVKEAIFMGILKALVVSGAAKHHYDELRNIDEFASTDRLIRNWNWVFPGDKDGIDCSEWFVVKIAGKWSRHFDEWLAPDPDVPILQWPS